MMIRNIRWAFIVILLFWGVRVFSQSVTVDAKIDSLQILIGEQARIRLQVSFNAKKKAIFPIYTDTLIKGVDIVEIAKPDTQYLNNKERLLITQEYIITSFDSALYYIPPFCITVDNKIYKSKALALKVYSVPVDTLNPDHFFGPKTVFKAPFEWEDWWNMIIASLLLFPCLALLIYLIIRLSDNKPIIRKIKLEPKLPPHEIAMNEIEKIKGDKKLQLGRLKDYYTDLTDAVRNYIKNRFGFNALEMTSSEIINRLMEVTDKANDISGLKVLFQTADLVKFAKHNPDVNENDANLINAIQFINETKETIDDNSIIQPTEITVVEKRSLKVKVALILSIITLSVIILFVLIFIVRELYALLA